MKKLFSVLIAGSFLLTACVQPVKPQKTSLEIQAIQAKTFDADKKMTFNSVMSVLQDLGYIIISASLDTGFITAESPIKQANPTLSSVYMFLNGGMRAEGKTAVTVSIEEISPKKTKVRLNLVEKRVVNGAYGQKASDDVPVEDPQVYVNAFDKIGEAIFIRQSQNSSPAQPSKSAK